MIKLVNYHHKHFEQLNAYQLDEEQARFTATIDYCVNKRNDLNDLLKTIVVIIKQSQAVGFFVLDSGADKLDLTDNQQSILIRSLSIHPDHQGRGIGTSAMMLVKDFVQQRFPGIDEIVLLVNFRNKSAYHVYVKAGYIDGGQVAVGTMGPQHVLSMSI